MHYTAAVLGLGNIGRCCVEALEIMPDCRCSGVVRRAGSLGKDARDLRGVPEFSSLDALAAQAGMPDVVLVAAPSRQAPDQAVHLLERGLCSVDSFDMHDQIPEVLGRLDTAAKRGQAVAVIAAGWDPGSDSVLRALFEAMVPVGTSFTNFGRGRSMGHSAAVRAMPGVEDAVSVTIPLGGGRHARLVYVALEPDADLTAVTATIKADPYFAHDPLEVRAVTLAELPFAVDASHGVLLERTGASGLTANQRLSFDMRIDNPALTAQIMVSCARAAVRLKEQGRFGAYTMIDLPPVMLLPGERLDNVKRLV